MTALAVDKCTYVSFYQTPQGYITLEISDDKCLEVTYEDAINTAIKNREEEASVSEDI